MPERPLISLKRFILWDYSRGSVPYDIMVMLILAFIFLIPREVFRDQPRGSGVVMLPAESDATVFYLDAELLAGYPESELRIRAQELIRKHTGGKRLRLVRLEPMLDPEKEVRGYMAFAEP